MLTDNSGTLSSLPDIEDEGNKEEEEDLFSGAKDAAAYQQSLIVKKSIQEMLGRRTGPRWSLPHDYIGGHTYTFIQLSLLTDTLNSHSLYRGQILLSCN